MLKAIEEELLVTLNQSAAWLCWWLMRLTNWSHHRVEEMEERGD